MQLIITQRQEITSRKGDNFVVYRGIADDGSTVEAFLTAQQATEFDIPSEAIVSKAQLKELFATLPVSDIEFNQRGRVQSLKA